MGYDIPSDHHGSTPRSTGETWKATQEQKPLKFKIEQVALFPRDPAAAIQLLTDMGAGEWARDHVKADGTVFGVLDSNEADLAFDYEMLKGANELEVLYYSDGPNWMDSTISDDGEGGWEGFSVSHFGMHCTKEELVEWKQFFFSREIGIAQEVQTSEHTNPHIAGKRWYHYCIFNTRPILGVDIKFIIRSDVPFA